MKKETINFSNLVSPKFIATTLRNVGYKDTQACEDIIDNSLEDIVGATTVDVVVTGDKEKKVSSISIIDNGCGMTSDVLFEALRLGSDTGKDFCDLGVYGSGLNASSCSMGKVLTVLTRSSEDNVLRKGVFDIRPLENKSTDDFCYVTEDLTAEEKNNFAHFLGEHSGTIVTISELDRITRKDVYGFVGNLKNSLALTFNKYIESKRIQIRVNGDIISPISVTGENYDSIPLHPGQGENHFTMSGGREIYYTAWWLPVRSEDIEIEGQLIRNLKNSGIYIYRNNRLVGKALNFGIQNANSKHSLYNGFRCEIFVDGNLDDVFGASFTKLIQDKTQNEVNQELYDKLANAIKPLALDCARRQNTYKKNSQETNEEIKENKKVLENVSLELGKNKMLGVSNHFGKNKKYEKTGEHKGVEKKESTGATRKRDDTWVKFDIDTNCSSHDPIFIETLDEKGRTVITLNANHTFYKKFFNNLDNNNKEIMAKFFAAHSVAKQKAEYYTNEFRRGVINDYDERISDAVYLAMDFN